MYGPLFGLKYDIHIDISLFPTFTFLVVLFLLFYLLSIWYILQFELLIKYPCIACQLILFPLLFLLHKDLIKPLSILLG